MIFISFIAITIILPIFFSEITVVFFLLLYHLISFTSGTIWYVIGGKIIMKRNKISVLPYEAIPDLYDFILKSNKKFNTEKRIYIGLLDEALPNAFTLFQHPKKYVIVVSVGLFENLEKKEIYAVLSHELFHVYNRDIWIKAAFIISRYFWIPLGVLFDSYISRMREIQADINSSQFTKNPLQLASALLKMVECYKAQPELSFRVNDVSKSFWLLNNHYKTQSKFLYTFFSRHPRIEMRIKNLLQLAE